MLKIFKHNYLTPIHISSASFHQREIRHHFLLNLMQQLAYYSDLCTSTFLSYVIICKVLLLLCTIIAACTTLTRSTDPLLTENEECGKKYTMAFLIVSFQRISLQPRHFHQNYFQGKKKLNFIHCWKTLYTRNFYGCLCGTRMVCIFILMNFQLLTR